MVAWWCALFIALALVLLAAAWPAMRRRLDRRIDARTAELNDAAARLSASQTQLASVVASASTVIITLDEAQRIVMFNREAERVFGVGADAMIGQPLDRLLPARSRAAHATAMQRFAHTGETLRRMGGEAQLHGLRADGQEFPIAASISRVVLPHGALLFTVVLRDLTEALALEAERTARQAAELASSGKSQLLSHVSHELRTPLNAIRGFTQLLSNDLEQRAHDPVHLDYLRHIDSASRQLDRLIGELLDYSRAEIGAMALVLQPIDPAVVLREAAAMIAPHALERRITLRLGDEAASSPAIVVIADEARLLQVIGNLLSNAVKYTASGGRVDAALRRHGDEVALDVSDNGDGLSDQQLAHLFEPFNRLGREFGAIPGSGIGLALSRQLMIAMRGRIEVASSPGQGSRFTIWLRAANDAERA